MNAVARMVMSVGALYVLGCDGQEVRAPACGMVGYSGLEGGTKPQAVATGDLNGDGDLDLVFANEEGVGVSLNQRGGLFASTVNYVAGTYAASVAVGDLNGDGKPDLAVPNMGSDNVSVLLNSGGGVFAPAVNYAVGQAAISVAMGDFNGDGHLDLGVVNNGPSTNLGEPNDGTVSVLLNTGNGTFAPMVNYATGGSYPNSIAVVDVNGDGKLDLAVANHGVADFPGKVNDGTASVLLNQGDGTFATAVTYAPGGSYPISIVAQDFDSDGKPDLAVGISLPSGVDIFYGAIGLLVNQGNGTFAPGVVVVSTFSTVLAVSKADMNGDDKPDLLFGRAGAQGPKEIVERLGVAFNKGNGTFDEPSVYTVGDDSPNAIAPLDIDNDGTSDLAITKNHTSEVRVFLNHGDGTLAMTKDTCLSK